MKNIRLPLAALLAPFSLVSLLIAGQAGAALTLDTTFAFDTDGEAEVDIDTGADTVRDIGKQDNDALVLAGTSRQTVGLNTVDYVALTRLNRTTGLLDTTFGLDPLNSNGKITFLPGLAATNGGGGVGRALVIQPDNKIVVAGTWKPNAIDGSQVFVARLDANGALDDSFGTAGVAFLSPAGVADPVANAMVLRSDGSIVVVGTGTLSASSVGFVVGLTSTGAPIPGFSEAVVPNPLAAPEGSGFGFNAVVVLPGDGILAAGGGGDLTLAQFTSAGALDTAFDADGIATFNVLTFVTAEGASSSFDVGTALTRLDDGSDRILIAGRTGSSSTSANTDRVLARVLSSGEPDTTFGSGGFAPLPDQGTGELVEDLGVRSSGDIVLVGQRFAPTQVSPNGIAVSAIPGSATLNAMADLEILTDGDVVAAGQRTVTGTNTAFVAVRLDATDQADGTDTVPDPFGFVAQSGLGLGVSATSNTVTITGLTASVPITISGGDQYSIGCTATFMSTAGTIANGDTVCVKTNASPSGSTAKTALLKIGEVSGGFTVVTGDATPDTITFAVRDPVSESTLVQSASATLAGFAVTSPISVVGGEYSIDCPNNFTKLPGTVTPNATVCVRHTSSAAGGTNTTTTLTVGLPAVSAVFTSKTEGVPNTTPDAFNFQARSNVALAAVITSEVVTIRGYDTAAPVSITGGEVSVGCGANSFTATPAPLPPDSLVCVRHTSPVTGGTATNTVLTVGGVSGTFTSTTLPGDADPAPFSFEGQIGVNLSAVELSATITSAPVTISGIDIASPVVVTGGSYSIGCTGPYVSTPGSVNDGQTVCVRHESAFDSETTVTTTLTIAAQSGEFRSTTKVGDQTPLAFGFTRQTGVALSSLTVSNAIMIPGIDSPVKLVSATGPPDIAVSVGCTGTFDASRNDIVKPADTLCIRVTSSATTDTPVVVTLTIGGTAPETQRTGEFIVTTGQTVPKEFAFTPQVGVALNAIATSDPVKIENITAPSKVEIASNGQYQLNCTGPFTSAAGLVKVNETICVRHRASAIPETETSTLLTVGGVSATFTSTTTEEQSLPGSSSMGWWSLLLAPLVVYRRRRSAFRRDR